MRDRLPSRGALLTAVGLIAVAVAPFGVDRGSQARAAFPGQNGKLAFVRSFDIWVANADGSNPIQLTTAPGLDRSRAGRLTGRRSRLPAAVAAAPKCS